MLSHAAVLVGLAVSALAQTTVLNVFNGKQEDIDANFDADFAGSIYSVDSSSRTTFAMSCTAGDDCISGGYPVSLSGAWILSA